MNRKMSLSVAADDMALPASRPRPYWHVLADIAYVSATLRGDEHGQVTRANGHNTDTSDLELAHVMLDRRRIATERALASKHLDMTRRGEAVSYATPAPSPFVSTVSDRKIKRGKRGPSVTVTRRGRVLVVGDSTALDDQDTRNGRTPRVVISHAIDELRRGNALGHVDGNALARLTTALYDIPDLIGTDHYSWSEATPEIPVADVAALVTHTCGISAGINPRVDAFAMPAAEWRAPRPIAQHVTRRRLTVPRPRKSDPAPRETVGIVCDAVRSWYHVTELPAGADQSGAMFHGHRLIKRGETVKRARATVYRDSFVVTSADDVATLAAIVMHDGAGKYRWHVAGDATAGGVVTVDKRGRVSVTGPGYAVRQCATVDALRKRLAAI